jgi:hypothetical protein
VPRGLFFIIQKGIIYQCEWNKMKYYLYITVYLLLWYELWDISDVSKVRNSGGLC